MLAAEENFWGRQRKEGRIKFEELSIVKDVPKIQPLGNISEPWTRSMNMLGIAAYG
jgi:hypothetical protein